MSTSSLAQGLTHWSFFINGLENLEWVRNEESEYHIMPLIYWINVWVTVNSASKSRKGCNCCTKPNCAKALMATTVTCVLSSPYESRRIPRNMHWSQMGKCNPIRTKGENVSDLEAQITTAMEFFQDGAGVHSSPYWSLHF